MKFSEVSNLNEGEVKAKISENLEELFRLRLKVASRQLNNTAHMTDVRKDIARLRTRERQLELEKAATHE